LERAEDALLSRLGTAARVAVPLRRAVTAIAPPAGAIPLRDVTVTVRPGGTTVYAAPDSHAGQLGELAAGTRQTVHAVQFGEYSWLFIPWENGGAWIPGEDTDFARSAAYNQVVDTWYETEAVLAFRRALAADLLRVRGTDAAQLARLSTLSGAALRQLEDTLARQTIPPAARQMRDLADQVGLPAPFEYLPVHTAPPAGINALEFQGFGPTTIAYEQWPLFYQNTRGMNPGLDFFVPEGSPLIAVADGVIVDFRFLDDEEDRSLALRPYLPETYRAADGSRLLSNVIVAYGHLTGDPTAELVRVGDTVRAGQIIGTSGWPIYRRDDGTIAIQGNNAHLHVQVHLVTDGEQSFGSRQPFNPLLFWSPRLVAFQARLAVHSAAPPYPTGGQPWGRLGFFTIGCFRTGTDSIVWHYEPTAKAQWPEGVYDLEATLDLLRSFKPYLADHP
jgi:murein DD-endopeptidase MepM/ murein hydrolase activator NlpD